MVLKPISIPISAKNFRNIGETEAYLCLIYRHFNSIFLYLATLLV